MNDTHMRDLTDKATEGPWESKTEEHTGGYYVARENPIGPSGFLVCIMPNTEGLPVTDQDKQNLDFIAATRQWVPEALGRLADQRGRIEQARALHAGEAVLREDGQPMGLCPTCRTPYPCPTKVALDG